MGMHVQDYFSSNGKARFPKKLKAIVSVRKNHQLNNEYKHNSLPNKSKRNSDICPHKGILVIQLSRCFHLSPKNKLKLLVDIFP